MAGTFSKVAIMFTRRQNGSPKSGDPQTLVDLRQAKRRVAGWLAVAVVLMLATDAVRIWLSRSGQPEPAAVPENAPTEYGYWQVSDTEFGPIRFDQSADSIEPNVGSYFQLKKDSHGCSTVVFPWSPVGTELIADDGQVIGVRVRSGKIETDQHIKIGSRERDVREAYTDSRYVVTEHAADGSDHDLVAARPMSAYEVSFRIGAGRVISYRAGNAAEL